MAQKRSVELEIKLQNAKSIGDLESVLKEINKELKTVDVGSEAFNQLSEQAKKADGSLKGIKDELRGISDEKQLDSVAKLGASLAGGLSVATVAASHFGEQTEESINAAIRTATELTVVVNAIKPIMEGLTSTNRRAFAEFVKGFKTSGVAATLFGNTTKAALISTGVGAFAVAVGLLIANWEAVTAAVNKFIDSIPFLKSIKDTVTDLVDSVGSLSNLFSGLGAFIVGAFTSGKSAVDEYNKAIERGLVLEALRKQTKEIETQVETRERLIKLLEVMGEKELEILSLQKQNAKELLDSYKERLKAGEEFSDDEKKRMQELADEVILLDIRIANTKKKNAEKEAEEAKKRREKALKEEIDAIVKQGEEERAERQYHIDLEKQVEEEFGRFKLFNDKKTRDEQMKNMTEQHRKELAAEKEAATEYLKVVKGKSDEELRIERENELRKAEEKRAIITEYTQAVLDGYNQIALAISNTIQREIDGLNMMLQNTNMAYEESVNNVRSLEAQLSEAKGASHDIVLSQLEKERKKEKQLAEERKKIQNQIITAENRKAQADWRNAIINATIQSALAVVEALPNVVLSAIVGVMGAASIATIAGNKPEPIPLMAAKGGYTGAGTVRDATGERKTVVQLHENEWVAPRWMVESAAYGGIIAQLEGIRQAKPMAEGGFSSDALPSVVPDTGTMSNVSASALKTAIENARIFVAVTEVRDVQTNVEVIESRISA